MYSHRCHETDYIDVHDGEDQNAQLVTSFCGTESSLELRSTSNYMYIYFRSDGYGELKGFAATYEFINKNSTPNSPTSTPTGKYTYCI